MSATNLRSEFLHAAIDRGYFNQCTDLESLDSALMNGVVTAYAGFDCTASSMHIGNLVGIMLLRRLQQAGHRPIALIGGGTTLIGDPSGKDETRPILSAETIRANVASISQAFYRLLRFDDSPTGALYLDNAEWLTRLQLVPFLRDVGPHFSVNRMLAMDSVRLRLDREQTLSFLEFNYMILQAYDFVELARRYGCILQTGGSDQWGNIVSGVELNRRMDDRATFGLTTPLITTSSGAKMGKTVSGAVWLNADMRSPYDYWQFWRNTEDGDVGRFMRLFTDLPLNEISRLEALGGSEINEAKKILATEATRLVHGDEAAAEAAATAQQTFEQGAAAEGLPTISVSQGELAAGMTLAELLVRSGLVASGGEARRLVDGGGARINDAPASSPLQTVTVADLQDGVLKLSAGKKRHALVRAE